MPAKAGRDAGGVAASLAQTRPVVDHPSHVLTNGGGHYVALLCRRTGALTRLGKGVRACAISGMPTKRRRRSKAELEDLDAQLYAIVRDVRPATVRQTFYQGNVHGLVDKDESGYNLVQRRLLKMRRAEVMPYPWITDNLRTVYGHTRYPGLESFTNDVARLYRRDYWAENPVKVEIWIEADSLASTIKPTVFDWGLDLHVARGFSSASYLYSAGDAIRHDGRETFVYVLTDFDPSGLIIAQKVAEGLPKFAGGVPIHVERLALNYEQVAKHGLPTRPLKKTDSRAKRFLSTYGDAATELDALSPVMLRQLVDEAISRHANRDRLEMLKLQEQDERRTLRTAFRGFGNDYFSGGEA